MFPREYSDLADTDMSPLRRDILLRHVAAVWGRYPRPPVHFESHPASTEHILSMPLRTDDVPRISRADKQLLLRLHRRFGPVVVNLERVSTSCALDVEDLETDEILENVAYATCAPILLDLERVFHRVHVGVVDAHYAPAWVYPELLVPFLSPQECRAQFDQVCCGCLQGMDWTDVVAAGGAVSACLTPRHLIKTQQALDAYNSMDVDLFALTPEAQDRTLEHFKRKFGSRVLFGFSRGVVVVCIRGVPRVFNVNLAWDTPTSLLTRFDLDFCQAALGEDVVVLTPACVRAQATRVCVVSPRVLPNRQHKALQKGFGIYASGDDVLCRRTFWDAAPGYVPTASHTDEQITFNMQLNLGCKHVTSEVDSIMNVLNTTDMRDAPEYVPHTRGSQPYTGTSFLTCELTRGMLAGILPPSLPVEGVFGYSLPYTLVFQRYMWIYVASCESVILRHLGYTAPGRADLLEFVDRVQEVMDFVYGEGECTYLFSQKHTLGLTVTPCSRILDVATQEVVDSEVVHMNTADARICTNFVCSTIALGRDWWTPIFTCREIEVFPSCMV